MAQDLPWNQTTKTDADEDVISTGAVIFGGVKIFSGTMGTVTIRATEAGTAIGGASAITGVTIANVGDVDIMVTDRGIALSGLTVEFSSTMNGIILWRHA